MVIKGILPRAYQLIRLMLERQGVRSAFVRVGDADAHYFDLPGEGSAPPIVLMHGLGGAASDFWRCLTPLKKVTRRVIAVDEPGFGFSPVPPSGPLRLEGLLTFFGGFFDRVVGEPAVIVGNSLGGAQAVRFTARRPEDVAATVLISPAGARMAVGRTMDVLRIFTGDGRELAERILFKPPRVLPRLLAADLAQMMEGPSIRKLVEDAQRAEPLGEEELRGLRPPVLLLWGKGERVLPYQNVDYFRAHLPPTAEVVEVEGFGHCPQIDRPAELCERIGDFVQRRVSRRAA